MTSGPQIVKVSKKSQRERMKIRRPHAQLVWVAIVVMLAGIVGIASAEESSILQLATMSINEIASDPNIPDLLNSLIAGSYKVMTHTDGIDNNLGKKEFEIFWPFGIEFVSVYV